MGRALSIIILLRNQTYQAIAVFATVTATSTLVLLLFLILFSKVQEEILKSKEASKKICLPLLYY